VHCRLLIERVGSRTGRSFLLEENMFLENAARGTTRGVPNQQMRCPSDSLRNVTEHFVDLLICRFQSVVILGVSEDFVNRSIVYQAQMTIYIGATVVFLMREQVVTEEFSFVSHDSCQQQNWD